MNDYGLDNPQRFSGLLGESIAGLDELEANLLNKLNAFVSMRDIGSEFSIENHFANEFNSLRRIKLLLAKYEALVALNAIDTSLSLTNGRISSVFRKVNGKPVVISDQARKRSNSFMSDCNTNNVGGSDDSSAPDSSPAPKVYAKSGGLGTSVLQKVNDPPVVISEEEHHKSEPFQSVNHISCTSQKSDQPVVEETAKRSNSFMYNSPPATQSAAASPHVGHSSSGRVSNVFQSASNKPVVISEEAARKSKSFLNNSEVFSSISSQSNRLIASSHSTNDVAAGGIGAGPTVSSQSARLSHQSVGVSSGRVSSVFQKVNGRPVVISEEASRKGDVFFSNSIDSSSNGASIGEAADVDSLTFSITPSSTGAVSQPSSAVVRPHPADPAPAVSSGASRVSSVFQKVSGAPVVISAEAVKRSESFLKKASSSTVEGSSDAVSNVAINSTPVVADLSLQMKASSIPVMSTGGSRVSSVFRKVNGSPVVISEEASRKSESFLNNGGTFDTPGGISNVVSSTQSGVVNAAPPTATSFSNGSSSGSTGSRVSSVFQKVNGRPVIISDEAMKKADSFLNSSSNSATDVSVEYAVVPVAQAAVTPAAKSTSASAGRVSSVFQKVNGKPVVISEEAIRKSESFLNDNRSDGDVVAAALVDSVVPIMNLNFPLVTPAKSSLMVAASDHTTKSSNISASSLFPVPFGAPASTTSKQQQQQQQQQQHSTVTPATPAVDLSSVQDPALARDLEWFFSLVEPPAVMTPDAVVLPGTSCSAAITSQRDHTWRVNQLSAISSSNVPQALEFEEDGVSFRINAVTIGSCNAASAVVTSSGKLAALLDAYGPLFKELYERILPENVDETLLCWLNMQLRWIAWTLASYERRAPGLYAFELLTFKSLLMCLQWRYDAYCSRPALIEQPPLSHQKQPPQTFSVVTPYTRRSLQQPATGSRSSAKQTLTSPIKSAQKIREIRQHVDAKTHFSKRGSMSPLQRSCDIACFIWPMVLCFCASTTAAATSALMDGAMYEVCDGWWWSEVKLDRELQQLVEKGLLRDGVKIAVFSATFIAPQGDSDASSSRSTASRQHILQLNYNNVRLARTTAKLGQIPPESLMRGVSMASSTEAGGPIYCIRGRILDVSCVMSKIKRSVDPSENATNGNSRGGLELNTILNHTESTELKKVLERLKQKTVDSLENMPELAMDSLLDSYGCDDDVIEDFKKLENGEDSFISPERMKELCGIKAGLEQHRHKVAMSLLNAKTRKYHIDEARFVDVLMECSVSKLHFWMRMMYRGDIDDDSSSSGGRAGAKFSLGSQFALGNEIAVANVKRIHTQSSLPLVMCSSGSRVTVLSSAESTTLSAAGIVQKTDSAMGSQMINSLRDVVIAFTTNQSVSETKYGGKFASGRREVSFICTIVDWIEQKPPSGDASGVDDGLISITIFGIDSSRTCVEIRYSFPVELVGKLNWLAKKNVILVQYGVIQQVDEKYDVIQVSKGDHTNIQYVSGGVNGSGGSSSGSPTKKATPNKRKYDDLSSSTSAAKGTPLNGVDLKGIQRFEVPADMFENEHRRYQALRNNANQFQAFHPLRKQTRRMIIEKCHRIHWNGVKILGLEERSSGCSGGDDDSQNAADSCSSGVGGAGSVEYSLSFEMTDGSLMKAVVDSTMVSFAQELADQVQVHSVECVCNLVAVDCFSVTENRSMSQNSVSGNSGGGEGAKSYLFSNEYKRIIWLGKCE